MRKKQAEGLRIPNEGRLFKSRLIHEKKEGL